MHLRLSQVMERALVATSLLVVTPGLVTARADDDGFLSRLFRGGSSSSNSSSSASRPTSGGSRRRVFGQWGRSGSARRALVTDDAVRLRRSDEPDARDHAPDWLRRPGPAALAEAAHEHARHKRSDPLLLTRTALGRSNDGSQFGMFLQVFTDGTVIDSEGVHHVRPADLKPIMDLVQSGDLTRTRGHCGAPATDFIEYVNIVVYERRLGRLWAHSLSYSGNTQGCDHAVRHLHTTLESFPGEAQPPFGRSQVPVGSTGKFASAVAGSRAGIDPKRLTIRPVLGGESRAGGAWRRDPADTGRFVEVTYSCIASKPNRPAGWAVACRAQPATNRSCRAACCKRRPYTATFRRS